MVLEIEWIEIHQIWADIGTFRIQIQFRYVASFRNEGDSKAGASPAVRKVGWTLSRRRGRDSKGAEVRDAEGVEGREWEMGRVSLPKGVSPSPTD